MTTPAAPQTTDTAFDPSDTRTFRHIAGHLASGVAVVTATGFCINYLAQSQRAISDVFATKSGAKFRNVAHRIRPSGQVEIAGALAVIECTLHERLRAGDHSIVIGRPVAMHGGDDEPLIHFRGAYRRIGAPLPPTAA